MTLLMLTMLACSLLPLPPVLRSQEQAQTLPTRTPLPTFTPTAPFSVNISIPPTPTETPIPPPATDTPTPVPEIPPTDTPVPEATSTDTPVPPPTEPPPPPGAPAPTEPPPPAEPVAGAHGVIGKINFRDGRNTYAVGEKVFVRIEATNAGSGLLPFGVLGLATSTGAFQTSWSNSSIASGETFRHEDGLAFSSPGTHKLWLSICFSSEAACQGPDGDWEQFEPGLDVVVQ